MHRFRTPKILLLGLAILAMTACSDNTLSQLAAASQTTSNPSTDTFTGTLSNGQSLNSKGWETHVYERVGRDWRISHLHYSSPPPRP